MHQLKFYNNGRVNMRVGSIVKTRSFPQLLEVHTIWHRMNGDVLISVLLEGEGNRFLPLEDIEEVKSR